jgi:5'-methylthioadenosine phosphorylase
MATALQQLGVKSCFSTAAVGSLREDWVAGTFVICSDFFDLTYRNQTLFHRTVEHRDFTHPFSPQLRKALIDSAEKRGKSIQPEGNYTGLNGPRYETPGEIQLYKRLGVDLVGMTGSTEAVLMREANIEYACLASKSTLDHLEVVEEMERSGEMAVNLILDAAKTVTLNR